MAYEIVVVGTSWGGLSALRELIVGLPATLGLPIVVVQHRHRESDHLLTTLLQDETSLCVCEVEDKAPMTAGNVYFAPADYHLLVEHGFFSLSMDEPVRFSRPSIDVTFQSAADTYGARAVGVVSPARMPMALRDSVIVSRGGRAFVQTPATAESPTMPQAAINAVPEAQVLTIAQIAAQIAALPSPAGTST